jgi:hypothetical protein
MSAITVGDPLLCDPETFDAERRVAHQRRIGGRYERIDPRPRASSLAGYSVKPVSRETAAPLIQAYEWLGTVRGTIFVGLFGPCGELQGAVCFGAGPAGAVEGRIGGPPLCLERGACVHYAPPNAASFLISRACKLVSSLTGVVRFYAYADPCAGEYGGVYQAAGWAYLGQGLNGSRGKGRAQRPFLLPPGADPDDPAQWRTDRALRRTERMTVEEARAAGWAIRLRPAKHVYATNVGRDRRRWRAGLQAQPYPAPNPERKRRARAAGPDPDRGRLMTDDPDCRTHPLAELFPLIEGEAFAELVEDIREHGLRDPVVMLDGMILDGRNRWRAAHAAGVPIRTVAFEGDDPRAYVVSVNLRRRHLTKGQQAMALAMAYPDTQQGRRETSPFSGEVGREQLRMARLVLAQLPTVAPALLVGDRSLADAYAEAVKVRDQNQSVEGRLQRLGEGAPDLAAQVREETMPLLEAEGAYQGRLAEAKRVEEERERRARSASTCLETILAFGQIDDDPRKTLDTIGDEPVEGLSPEACRAVSSYLTKLADLLESRLGDADERAGGLMMPRPPE